MTFEPEPQHAVRCHGAGCGHGLLGYQHQGYHPATMYCIACAEQEWQKRVHEHEALMAADREALGDEAFVKVAIPDATVQPSGPMYRPSQFYILTWKHSVTDVTGSSGYSPTPEAAWTKMADKIDRYLREPHR